MNTRKGGSARGSARGSRKGGGTTEKKARTQRAKLLVKEKEFRKIKEKYEKEIYDLSKERKELPDWQFVKKQEMDITKEMKKVQKLEAGVKKKIDAISEKIGDLEEKWNIGHAED